MLSDWSDGVESVRTGHHKGVFFLPVDVFLIIGVLLNDGVSVLDVLDHFLNSLNILLSFLPEVVVELDQTGFYCFDNTLDKFVCSIVDLYGTGVPKSENVISSIAKSIINSGMLLQHFILKEFRKFLLELFKVFSFFRPGLSFGLFPETL